MKNLKYLLLIIPFMFINNVKADTVEFNNLNQGTDLSIQ